MKTNKLTLFTSLLVIGFASCKKIDDENPQNQATIRPVTSLSSAYVTQLFDYTPAPGQFINTTVGNTDGAKTVLNGKTGLVSLGAFGGGIVLGFDHTVLNQPGKDDIVIYNNASSGSAEPGVVWVMQDSNNNGKPDDTWYELSGSAQQLAGYKRNYSITYTRPAADAGDVTWVDSDGNKGAVKTNIYHKQAYYPAWITTANYTVKGTLLPASNINDSNPTFITSNAFAYGYADNIPGGDKIDIANAIDDKGNKKDLVGIDFIKVQTGIPFNLGWLGELSTEVKGIADISIEKP